MLLPPMPDYSKTVFKVRKDRDPDDRYKALAIIHDPLAERQGANYQIGQMQALNQLMNKN
jgi:hypothetical protein